MCLAVQNYREICLERNRKGANTVLFPSERLSNRSQEEQELHPTPPVHPMTASGQNKVRKPVVTGSVSSHSVFPCHQCQLLPPLSRTNYPSSCSPLNVQKCCRKISFSVGWFSHYQLTYPTPRYLQTFRHSIFGSLFIISTALWVEAFKDKTSWPKSDEVCPLNSPYLLSGC